MDLSEALSEVVVFVAAEQVTLVTIDAPIL